MYQTAISTISTDMKEDTYYDKVAATKKLFKTVYGAMISTEYCSVLSEKEVYETVVNTAEQFRKMFLSETL